MTVALLSPVLPAAWVQMSAGYGPENRSLQHNAAEMWMNNTKSLGTAQVPALQRPGCLGLPTGGHLTTDTDEPKQCKWQLSLSAVRLALVQLQLHLSKPIPRMGQTDKNGPTDDGTGWSHRKVHCRDGHSRERPTLSLVLVSSCNYYNHS